MKMAQRIATASLLLAFFLPAQSYGAASEWVTSPGGAFRIVASQPKPDGFIPAMLEVRLTSGWKTYWRDPGASGIPPQVTLDPSGGVSLQSIRFPAPKTFGEGPGRYIGYDAPVAFPLTLKRTGNGGDVTIRASIFLGICEDICIPVQGDVSLSLKSGDFDNPLDDARIEKAISALPEQPSEDFRLVSAKFDATTGLARLEFELPRDAAAGPADLFLAGPPGVFFGEPVFHGERGAQRRADVPVKVSGKAETIAGKPITLTLRAGSRSMETTLAFD
ncbi:protein-disulfide reductase DsbD domain-containing protein [Sinorhizobium arboris]|uniref:protein-disulfide reductase DsbD domain-containing protein n=1 Tax=Sinorhizobium arboris TaxID=76745 RepID=UPI0004803B97|nr:protein-disulfide reductase DsbD domain-containing protein [Sinorhizobium arboris]